MWLYITMRKIRDDCHGPRSPHASSSLRVSAHPQSLRLQREPRTTAHIAISLRQSGVRLYHMLTLSRHPGNPQEYSGVFRSRQESSGLITSFLTSLFTLVSISPVLSLLLEHFPHHFLCILLQYYLWTSLHTQ